MSVNILYRTSAIATGGRDGDAQRLVDTAHQICPYSNATRNNVDVQLTII
jgi:osmotically inducible protein OsmC